MYFQWDFGYNTGGSTHGSFYCASGLGCHKVIIFLILHRTLMYSIISYIIVIVSELCYEWSFTRVFTTCQIPSICLLHALKNDGENESNFMSWMRAARIVIVLVNSRVCCYMPGLSVGSARELEGVRKTVLDEAWSTMRSISALTSPIAWTLDTQHNMLVKGLVD